MKTTIWLSASLLCVACSTSPKEEVYDDFVLIHQEGPTLGYCPNSGVQILREGNHAFKDLNRNGQLDVYEDWRLDVEERIADLASQLSLEEIAGLMLYIIQFHCLAIC